MLLTLKNKLVQTFSNPLVLALMFAAALLLVPGAAFAARDRKSTRLNSSHLQTLP